jgi:hypothetical protein
MRLVPLESRLSMLEQDYRKMQEMFFGEPTRQQNVFASLTATNCLG